MDAPAEPPPNRVLDSPTRPPLRSRISDDGAYLLPFFTFLLFTWVGGTFPSLYPLSYVAKAVLVTALLVWLWPRFTRIRWDYWWLGVIAGVLGILQWVPMQLWLQANTPFFKPPPAEKLFNPFDAMTPGWLAWTFVAIRIASASLLVPVMEELFWRDYLWRRIIAPNDFKLAYVGEWDWKAYVGVSLAFAVVHPAWWLTSIVWGFMVGALLLYTRSLGACIIMHGVTNALLAAYVLYYRDWAFW